jgi:hypothetical protein
MSDADTLAPILAEIATALRVAEPLAKGLALVRAGDLSPSARTIVDEVFTVADTRRQALVTRRERLQALVDGPDPYAPIPPQVVSRAVFAELQQNLAAGQAALGVLQADPRVMDEGGERS